MANQLHSFSPRKKAPSDQDDPIAENPLWMIINSTRAMLRGSYKVSDSSIVIDDKLDPIAYSFVFLHEAKHKKLSEFHYGEMLRRINAINILVFSALNPLRVIIIREVAKSKSIDSLQLVSEPEGIDSINQALLEDSLFMEALNFMADIDAKYSLLTSHWREVQEGGAYWLTFNSWQYDILPKVDREDILLYSYAESLFTEAKREITNREDYYGKGLRNVTSIEHAWGKEWVFPVLEACLCPDIRHLAIFDNTLSSISEMLESPVMSPDHRLERTCEIASEKSFSPPVLKNNQPYEEYWYALAPLMKMLDPDNSKPPLTVKEFNTFWNTQDSHPVFVGLMNRLYKRLGATEEILPIATNYTREHRNLYETGFILARDYSGTPITYWQYDSDNVEDSQVEQNYQRQASLEIVETLKSGFLQSMKKAGLING